MWEGVFEYGKLKSVDGSSPLVLFSWGYWGWGNSTGEFVQAADAVEKIRGFEPPVFVDARLRRSVRAVGFRDAALERLVGTKRYRWMKGLGNKALDQDGLELSDPEGAEALLDLALEDSHRRCIFFCACEFRLQSGKPACHRSLVTRELIERAKRRSLDLSVVEWPGTPLGEKPLEWEVSASTLKGVTSGKKALPVEWLNLAEAAGIAWGTPVRLRAGAKTASILTGPARFQGKRWVHPVLMAYEEPPSDDDMLNDARRLRRDLGYEPEGNAPG